MTEREPDLISQLAGARIDAAKAKLDERSPDEALALLVSALKADPASAEAQSMVEAIFDKTVWNIPALSIDHQMPIDQVSFAPPSSLWVSLGGTTNTTVRWNLSTSRIESVLFPVSDCRTRSLIFDQNRRWVVVERGPVTLLCNAQTLKPIRDLGPLPEFLTPSSVVVFSEDGLLMAHPGFVSENDRALVWHLRDTATGQIIRTSEPLGTGAPRPLAAFLDRTQLRVISVDGSLFEMPISPVEEIHRTLPEAPVKLLQAQFSLDGHSALALQDLGPHQSPVQSVISFQENLDTSLEPAALLHRFPWSHQPNLWNGLMNDAASTPFTVEGNSVRISLQPHAPIQAASPVSAAVFDERQVITGGTEGILTIHQLLEPPVKITGARKPGTIGRDSLTALENLSAALAALRYDENERAFVGVNFEDRVTAFKNCDFGAIRSIYPNLDFSGFLAEFEAASNRIAPQEALRPLTDRLSRWKSGPDAPEIEKVFREDNPDAIRAAIHSAGGKGPAAATALALALKSERPEWIEASLTAAADLPPLLREIARSRIAWLQGRKADALSNWPETFPELAEIRRREDWDGWEQADFKPALDNIRQCVTEELAAIVVPENSTPEQRKAVADRLADPATVAAVGKRRFAEACMKAALAFSSYKEEAETTFHLANLARSLGAPPEPCLRAEALALTALGDFEQAHPRWIQLLTEHPVETTLPGDYAEAAYTAFENSNAQQAMEILTTGMHRFPEDGNFALRAGWVALLIGNSQRAYEFLLIGQRIGFPAEKLENGTALLTIAAAQIGAYDDASVYFQDLLRIDPAWEDPATLDTLDWPEDLKFTLGQFTGPTILMPDP